MKGCITHHLQVQSGEESVISTQSGESDVQVKVDILGLRGVKLKDRIEPSELNFDISAKLEEKERSGKRVVGFVLTVGTKPIIEKFEVEGIATIE